MGMFWAPITARWVLRWISETDYAVSAFQKAPLKPCNVGKRFFRIYGIKGIRLFCFRSGNRKDWPAAREFLYRQPGFQSKPCLRRYENSDFLRPFSAGDLQTVDPVCRRLASAAEPVVQSLTGYLNFSHCLSAKRNFIYSIQENTPPYRIL